MNTQWIQPYLFGDKVMASLLAEKPNKVEYESVALQKPHITFRQWDKKVSDIGFIEISRIKMYLQQRVDDEEKLRRWSNNAKVQKPTYRHHSRP